MNMKRLIFILLLLPIYICAECTCDKSIDNVDENKSRALKLKLIAIASILVASAIGVCLPLIKSFKPESKIFLSVKFFTAGVILATGFVHVFPDANESLENPCIGDKFWGDFPLANLLAMLAAVAVVMVEKTMTSWFDRSNDGKIIVYNDDVEKQHGDGDHVHGSHTHAYLGSSEGLLHHRIISYVLEVGIIIHSVIIGISLGVSMSPKIIKPLIVALSFHQMFEGMGLGSYITEAQFKIRTIATMSTFFSLTTPIGIVCEFLLSNIYDENSRTALIVQGVLNVASTGILIYMALVDFLTVDFMKSNIQTSSRLQALAFVSILVGIGCMSLLALWA
ncbi:zinc transporter 5-like [Rutidosis leptorrhynchoides]|uniref:zinc transporter 5-like n=1 Tax=Rutidosis leptorrhynchoides TaxID=125765 RepID=UPI003A994CF1